MGVCASPSHHPQSISKLLVVLPLASSQRDADGAGVNGARFNQLWPKTCAMTYDPFLQIKGTITNTFLRRNCSQCLMPACIDYRGVFECRPSAPLVQGLACNLYSMLLRLQSC